MEWDLYFLNIAKEVSKQSKCLSRQIGAVLVQDKTIISTGYNGPARGVKHCNERDLTFYYNISRTFDKTKLYSSLTAGKDICPRQKLGYSSGQGLQLCQAGHAERNALIQCARHGVITKGATLYCYCGQVCKDCAIEIVNAGIKELVYLAGCNVYDKYAEVILRESGIEVRTIMEERDE